MSNIHSIARDVPGANELGRALDPDALNGVTGGAEPFWFGTPKQWGAGTDFSTWENNMVAGGLLRPQPR